MAGNNVQQLLVALLSTDNDIRSKAEVKLAYLVPLNRLVKYKFLYYDTYRDIRQLKYDMSCHEYS